jgi:hypothetical protein
MSSKIQIEGDYPLWSKSHGDYVGKPMSDRIAEHFDWSSGRRYQWGNWAVLQKITYVDSIRQYVTDDFALIHLWDAAAEIKVFIGDDRKMVSCPNL